MSKTRDPTTSKGKDCDELRHLDIPFAIKEYLQNSVGQILKDSSENVSRREVCKAALLLEEPQLVADGTMLEPLLSGIWRRRIDMIARLQFPSISRQCSSLL